MEVRRSILWRKRNISEDTEFSTGPGTKKKRFDVTEEDCSARQVLKQIKGIYPIKVASKFRCFLKKHDICSAKTHVNIYVNLQIKVQNRVNEI